MCYYCKTPCSRGSSSAARRAEGAEGSGTRGGGALVLAPPRGAQHLGQIDADGDGVITKAEAKSASAGAAMVQLGPSALVGCLAGILCYVLCRVVVARCLPRRCPRTAPIQHRVSGLLQPRAGKPSSVAHSPPPPPLGLGVKGGEAVSSQDKATRMRKRHGECGPATAC